MSLAPTTAALIREVRLIKSEIETNANKYWYGALYSDGLVYTEWGRVGYPNPQHKSYPGGGEAKISAKEKEKLGRGYAPVKTVGENGTTQTNVVSHNKQELARIAQEQISVSSPTLTKLIQRLVEANIHQITSSTQITYDTKTGLFSTPLGIVTPDGIADARQHLENIQKNLNQPSSPSFLQAVNSYFRLVPTKIGMRGYKPELLFPNQLAVDKQLDILESLEASYEAMQKETKTTNGKTRQEQLFSVELAEADEAEFRRVERKYYDTRKDMHACAKLRVKKVYRVVIKNMAQAFETHGAPLGNVKELWHGTRKANLLSILKSGLKVAPPSTAAIAGAMFGSGIYFAPSSTKSLNYSYGGVWRNDSRERNCFMFLAQVATGRAYTPNSGWGTRYPQPGYDSTWAKAGVSGVINDEIVVYKDNQCNLTHLVEFE